MKLRLLMTCCFLPLVAVIYSQTIPQEIYDNLNKSASVYYAYPQVDEQYTPAPADTRLFIYHIMAVTVRAILLPILIIYR